MKLKNIDTKRLTLIPITLQVSETLINGENAEVEKLGLKVNKAWPTDDTRDILPIIVKVLKENEPSGFETWMIVKKDNSEVIGDIGFHGGPDEAGEVEIGYGIVEEERKNGFGFEAARAIFNWAIERENVNVIKADCLINNIPSAKILKRLGMKETNRDDELIYWKYDKMAVNILKILVNEEKAKITDNILRNLPEWFGIEEAIVEYVEGVKNTDFYAAYVSNKPVGFISIKTNNIYTSEIYVVGILREYHGNGLGRELLNTSEKILIESEVKFLMVKTLGESHPDKNYKETRKFYKKVGFYPLEEIEEIWGKANPCLIMVKNLV